MKKIVILAMVSLLATAIYAQSVFGIGFGASYQQVKDALEKRFGSYNVYEEKGVLKVFDFDMGDYHFNTGSFEFQYRGSSSWFYYANFQKNFSVSSASAAKDYRESMKRMLLDKYPYYIEYTNNQGYKCYEFFLYESSEDPACALSVAKERSKGGDYFIYLQLTYGPYYYINKTSDF